MAGAAFHTGSSKQDYQTPREFIAAVQQRFGPLAADLAAHEGNHVCEYWIGPGYPDSLAMPWHEYRGLLWLNPPYSNIKPWAQKCALESQRGAEILFLVPASVGSNWYWDHVAPYSDVYALSPRLSFDGKHPFPKDLILAHFCRGHFGFSRWRWK